MKFDRIRAGRYGALVGLDSGPDPLPALVVVSGPNEAGKSTFFRLLTSILYGFSPANREQNRDVPWDGDEADGAAWIRTDSGKVIEVRRVLRSTPWGRRLEDGHEEDIRNRPLGLLDQLPRGVFRQVFALTLAEVAGLEAESWAEVQDRLASAMGARDLVPPRDAAERLESEAGSLWRPNRRGKQSVRRIGEEIRRAEKDLAGARERDREMRDLTRRVAEGRRTLARLREERANVQVTEERVSRLLPIHRQLSRIEELEGEAGNVTELEELPLDPADRLASLRERVAVFDGRLQELEALEAGLAENQRRARSVCQELWSREWTDHDRARIRTASPARVRDRLRAYHQAVEARRVQEAGASGPDQRRRLQRLLRGGAAVGGLGLATLIVGTLTGQAGLVVLGVAAAAIGGAVLTRLRGASTPGPRPALVEAERAAMDEVRRSVETLGLRPELLEPPTLELPGLLQRLQELEHDLEVQVRQALEIVPEAAGQPSPADHDQLSLGFEPPAEAAAPEGTLAPAGDAVARTAEAQRRLAAGRRALQSRRATAIDACTDLQGRLARLGDGDADLGAERATHRLVALRTARELASDLAREHDVDALRTKIAAAVEAGEAWTREARPLEALQRSRKRLTDRIEELGRSLERDEQEARRLREMPTPDDIEGEILALTEERERLARERDRKIVLARLIRAADQRFRSERQPRVLRRAGEILALVTGQRYGQIVSADEDGRDVFKLRGEAYPHPVPLDRGVSTGTREQAYLALRLAAVEELDRGGERLPVFVDEVFVNWDARRSERGLELMARLAETRQVFVFTCRTGLAEALERFGACRISLESGTSRALERAR